MEIREYRPTDCKPITDLFYNTVHTINSKDYTEDQLNVWATKDLDLYKWNESLLANHTLVALIDGIIIGFGDIDRSGYLDHLFTHKDYQGIGVATSICKSLESSSKFNKITTDASITAKPFFEKRGYKLIKEQKVERNGIILINYHMEKHIL